MTITTILSLVIGGCSVLNGQTPSSETVATVSSVSTFQSDSIETTAESTIASSMASSQVTASAFDPEVAIDFSEELGAGYMYQDKFIPQQFLYISDKKIVIAFFLGGTEQIREIDRSKFSRMEITKTSDFAQVKIFDVSGSILSINLSPEDADEIQSVLG
ncbi:MAG: hypothetical protein K5779_01655 [Saccharofermentans sp.]|nr:hypothetical protein [Saccharofermentans sp.]